MKRYIVRFVVLTCSCTLSATFGNAGAKSNDGWGVTVRKTKPRVKIEYKATPPNTATDEQICRATIAALMGRDPKTIKAKAENGIVHLSYLRARDHSRWSNRCRIQGKKIVWATATGRWRTHPLDGSITYNILQAKKEVEIIEEYFNKSLSRTKYKFNQLK